MTIISSDLDSTLTYLTMDGHQDELAPVVTIPVVTTNERKSSEVDRKTSNIDVMLDNADRSVHTFAKIADMLDLVFEISFVIAAVHYAVYWIESSRCLSRDEYVPIVMSFSIDALFGIYLLVKRMI